MGAAYADRADNGHSQSRRATDRLKFWAECGHARHVGTCPSCQRAQLARWNAQLVSVTVARQAA